MSDEPNSFAKAAPIKLRRQRKLTNPLGAAAVKASKLDNIVLKHLNIGVNWFDDNSGPEPWVWASALSLHLFLMAIFISIPPMEFKQRPVFGVEIINETEPKEPEPLEFEPTKKPPQEQKIEPLEKAIPSPKSQIKDAPKAIEDIPIAPEIEPEIAPKEPENITPPAVRIPPPEEVKSTLEIMPKIIEKREFKTKKQISAPKIAAIESIKPDEIDEPIDEIMTPDKIVLEPIKRPNLQDSKRLETKSGFIAEPRKIGAGNLKQNNNSIIPSINPNLQIDVEELRREAEAKEAAAAAAQNAREQAMREAAKQSMAKSANSANTAPIAKNGELAPPSGAGVTAIGQNPLAAAGGSGSAAATGGGAQNANTAAGGGVAGGANGPLPRGPRIVGSGRNVFENSENGSLLARMARTADCSNINRERDEKCPNWEPLEKAPKAIPAPIPKNATRPKTGIDPLPACPPGTPQSNMGRTCLPSKSSPNGTTQ